MNGKMSCRNQTRYLVLRTFISAEKLRKQGTFGANPWWTFTELPFFFLNFLPAFTLFLHTPGYLCLSILALNQCKPQKKAGNRVSKAACPQSPRLHYPTCCYSLCSSSSTSRLGVWNVVFSYHKPLVVSLSPDNPSNSCIHLSNCPSWLVLHVLVGTCRNTAPPTRYYFWFKHPLIKILLHVKSLLLAAFEPYLKL